MVEQSVRSVLVDAAARLAAAKIEDPAREARLLIACAMGLERPALLRDPCSPADVARVETILRRRLAREPMALITGYTGFWTLDLEVSRDTLIPRPDTETLIEAAKAATISARSILDLGTGTGCLLLAALTEYPAAWGLGVDRVPAACALAARNAARNRLADRSAVCCADWAAPIRGEFDLILANPPYIRHGDIPTLMPEVARYEPASALDGGADGLDAYRALLGAIPSLLTPAGVTILELGAGQSAAVAALAQAAGFDTSARKDLAGHDRALTLHRRSGPQPCR